MTAAAISELESRLVAGVLVESADALSPVRRILDPSILQSRQARAIYEALIALADRGESGGIGAVRGEILATGGEALFPGGLLELDAQADLLSAPTSGETIALAKTLAEFARRRRAQTAAQAFAKDPSAERRATLAGVLREQEQVEACAPASLPSPLDYRALARDGGAEVLWQIAPVLPQRGLGDLTSIPGAGKTWLLLDAAISIASGELVWGRFQVPRPGPVCYFDEENGPEELCRRLTLLERARGLAGRDLPISPFCFLGLKLDDPQGFDMFRAILNEYRPALVVLDSSIRFHRQQENDNSGMSIVTEAMRRLAVGCDTSILSAHHPNKPGMYPKSLIDRGRGAGEIIAGLDTYLFAQPMTDGSIRVSSPKVRRGVPPPPFALRLEDDPEGGVHISHLADVQPDAEKKGSARAVILTELHTAGDSCDRPTLEEACRRAGVEDRTASDTIKELVKIGAIAKGELVDRKRMYRLTETGREGLEWE